MMGKLTLSSLLSFPPGLNFPCLEVLLHLPLTQTCAVSTECLMLGYDAVMAERHTPAIEMPTVLLGKQTQKLPFQCRESWAGDQHERVRTLRKN